MRSVDQITALFIPGMSRDLGVFKKLKALSQSPEAPSKITLANQLGVWLCEIQLPCCCYPGELQKILQWLLAINTNLQIK